MAPAIGLGFTAIPNQDAFEDMFEENIFQMNVLGSPYIFGWAPPPPPPEEPPVLGIEFTVTPEQQLLIDPGVTIQFNADVNLIIQGLMQQTDDNDVVTFTRMPEAEPWESIQVIDNDNNQDDIGSILLLRVLIEGGGAGELEEGMDWRGLIRVDGLAPVLEIGNPEINSSTSNILRDSQTNGIVVTSTAENCNVELYRVFMNDEEQPIALNGIKFNDPAAGNFGDQGTWPHLRLDFSTIQFCGRNGLIVSHTFGGDYTINNSYLENNGTIEAGEGCGVFFDGQEGIYQIPCEVYIYYSGLNSNRRDGARFDHFSGRVVIVHSTISENAQYGIFRDFEGFTHCSYIEQNLIQNNGWEGLCVRKGAGGALDAGIKIRGNTFADNGQEFEVAFPNGEEWLANLRIQGCVGSTAFFWENREDREEIDGISEIRNNIIEGCNLGILLIHAGVIRDPAPEFILIRNNIQYGAALEGLKIEDIGDNQGEGPDPDRGDDPWPANPPRIENNLFYGNGADGIWIGDDVPIGFAENVEVIRNNIIAANENFGILYLEDEGVAPWFDFNGFFNNGEDPDDDVEGCGLVDATCIRADPRFVSPIAADFHLLWSSPMINRGMSDFEEPEDGLLRDAPYLNSEDYPRDGRIIDDDPPVFEGSPNDIGPYGGPWADGWGFEPYCAIPANAQVTNENLPHHHPPDEEEFGDREWLEWDYYRIFGDFSTPNGEEIDIGDPDIEIREEEDIGRAYFEFNYSAKKWTIYGEIRANGIPGEVEEQTITFTCKSSASKYHSIYVYIPDDACRFYGTIFKGASYPLYLYNTQAAPLRVVDVNNCTMSNGSYSGITAYNHLQLLCTDTDIFDCNRNGIYLNSNYQVANQPVLSGVTIHDCNSSASTYGGLYCDDSSPSVVNCHFYDNADHGIYLIGEFTNPAIQGQEDGANTIANNGPAEQEGAVGAEIRIADADAMDDEPAIRSNNIWDVLNDNGNGVRRGVIIATVTVADIVLDNGVVGDYYGDNLEAEYDELDIEIDFDDMFNPEEDLLATGAGMFVNDLGVENEFIVEDEMLLPNRLGDMIANARTPENEFEEGLHAMKAGDYETARNLMRYWMREHSAHSKAPAAARNLFRLEYSLGGDLMSLRREYLGLSRSIARENPRLAWATRKTAVKCLTCQGLYEEALAEYSDLIEDAPDTVEALFLDNDRLLVQMMLDGPVIDAAEVCEARIDENMERVEEIYAQRMAEGEKKSIPTKFELTCVYPNPFNSTAVITFALPKAGVVELSIYDMIGRRIQSYSRFYTAGRQTVSWRADDVPSGTYFFKASALGTTKSQNLILVR